MKKNRGDVEIGIRDLRTLIDRTTADERAITRGQFYTFLDRPEGPQGHPDMVAYRKLLPETRLVEALPSGELVTLREDVVSWESGQSFGLPVKTANDEWTEVIGIRTDGIVVGRSGFYDRMDGTDHPGSLYIGSEKISDTSHNATLLTDDSLVWTRGSMVHRLFPDGRCKVREMVWDDYRFSLDRFVLEGDYLLARCVHKDTPGRTTVVDPFAEEVVYDPFCGVARALWSRGELYLLVSDPMKDSCSAVLASELDSKRVRERWEELVARVKEKHMADRPVHDFVRLSDGRFAAKVAIHWQPFTPYNQHEAWYVGGRPSPKFDQVTRPFVKDGRDCYYARVGSDLFTMQFPLPTSD